MDRAEEISRRLVHSGRAGVETTLQVQSALISKNKFLPDLGHNFYAYLRRRIEMMCDSQEYAINALECAHKQTYCGMVMQAQNAYYLLGVQPDHSTVLMQLDMSELPEYTIYPGQIIEVSGTNIIGDEIVADSVLYNRIFQNLEIAPKEGKFTLTVIDEKRVQSAQPLASEGIDEYAHILDIVRGSQSDLVVIFGDLSCEARKVCKEIATAKRTRILCVPYIDGIESSMAYPTEYTSKTVGYSMPASENQEWMPNLYDVSSCFFAELQNPSMVCFNGVLLALTTLDVLLGISRKEVSRNRGERMDDILVHSVYQSTFLPFIPQDVPVDYSVFNAFLWAYSPDMYIFPTCLSARPDNICSTHVIPVCTGSMELHVECTADERVTVQVARDS
ncbi:DNA polymerase alpha subunit B [Nematocida ausubeli]|nr:DNA polymerase alpha subunit B [Nematocida ausubeli]